MAETTNKPPAKVEQKPAAREVTGYTWRPFENLRQEIDQIFDNFGRDFWRSSLRRPISGMHPFRGESARWMTEPAVDIVENDKMYEITVELPGMDEKNIEVKLANGGLTIKGEKQEEKEEKKQDYYLHERSFGSFERNFAVPDGVDTGKIEANFKKGVLKITLPKRPDAIKPERKIEVKSTV